MKNIRNHTGFTLVELMVALIVVSIILAAVSTLAGATTAANEATDQMGREQAQLRQMTMQLSDLIRRANRVTISAINGFQLWHDTNADGIETADERTTIIRGADFNGLEIVGWGTYQFCENVSIDYDAAAPDTRFVMISFTVNENGRSAKHTINSKLRLAGNGM